MKTKIHGKLTQKLVSEWFSWQTILAHIHNEKNKSTQQMKECHQREGAKQKDKKRKKKYPENTHNVCKLGMPSKASTGIVAILLYESTKSCNWFNPLNGFP